MVFTPYLGVKMLPAIKLIEGGHHAIYDTPNYRRLRGLITFAVRHKFVTCGIVGIAFALRCRHGRRQAAVLPDIRPP